MRVLTVGTDTVEYDDRGGPGEPMLLVHAGVFGAWLDPLAQSPLLRGSRVIRMRRAGYVGGAVPAGHLGMADHAAHCAALLESLGVRRAHVVGHSSGSVIALQLAIDRPDLVNTLVLGEPPLLAHTAPEDTHLVAAARQRIVDNVVPAARAGNLAEAFATFMTAVCGADYPGVLTAALGADGLVRAERESRFFFTDELPAVGEWQLDEQAAGQVKQPVLLVQGAASSAPLHRMVNHLATVLPNAEIATIGGDNHLLPLRSTTAFAQLIAAFVAATPVVRRASKDDHPNRRCTSWT
jgi:pimeloyl-ACP methyl ester carboxylesterase